MRSISIVESTQSIIDLTANEARLLNDLGRQLASKTRFWGEAKDEPLPAASIIRCTYDGSKWSLFVQNAIGLIRVSDLQVLVRPKIPLSHVVFLMSLSGALPRFIPEDTLAESSEDFLELIARWFMFALDGVLRRDLIRDYCELADDLTAARGQVDALATGAHFYAGRLELSCRFEDFDLDTPLNRILKAGANAVAGNPGFGDLLRRSASRVIRRLDDVSSLRAGDFSASTDRRTSHYQDALILAELLIQQEARTVELGGESAWSFLIPTPGAVERGVRTLLTTALAPWYKVTNRSRHLRPGFTVNPDIVFEDIPAVADVKYKLAGGEWGRGDLYQGVAFAAAYNAKAVGVLSFSADAVEFPDLAFGDIRVRSINWDATPGTQPQNAAGTFTAAVIAWLKDASSRTAPQAKAMGLVG